MIIMYGTKLDWILLIFYFVYFPVFMVCAIWFIVSLQFVVYSSQFLGSYFVILFMHIFNCHLISLKF